MDHALKEKIYASATHLLDSSTVLEKRARFSATNPFEMLTLLNELGPVTSDSLQAVFVQAKSEVQATPEFTSKPESSKLNVRPEPKAEVKPPKSNLAQERLQNLLKSDSSSRRRLGVYSPIIKNS